MKNQKSSKHQHHSDRDADWKTQRRRLWDTNAVAYRELIFQDLKSAADSASLKRYVLSGDENELVLVPGNSPSLKDLARLLFNPERGRETIRSIALSGTTKKASFQDRKRYFDRIHWLLCRVGSSTAFDAYRHFPAEVGFLNGDERTLLHALLPDQFNADAWQRESEPTYLGPPSQFPPEMALRAMIDGGIGFLTCYAMNPHHPIQDFITYWAQTLPSLDEKALRERSTKQELLALFHLVAYFREPRGQQGETSMASSFQQQLAAVLNAGTGNPAVDALWQFTNSTDGRRGPDFGAAIPDRVAFCPTRQPDLMRRIANAFAELGFGNHLFDVDLIDIVDIGPLLNSRLARALRYDVAQTVNDWESAGCVVPAFCYQLHLQSALGVCGNGEIKCSIDLFQPILADHAPNADLPRILMLATQKNAPKFTGGGFHELLCERQVALHLSSTAAITLARRGEAMLKPQSMQLVAEGSEWIWNLEEYFSVRNRELIKKLRSPEHDALLANFKRGMT